MATTWTTEVIEVCDDCGERRQSAECRVCGDCQCQQCDCPAPPCECATDPDGGCRAAGGYRSRVLFEHEAAMRSGEWAEFAALRKALREHDRKLDEWRQQMDAAAG